MALAHALSCLPNVISISRAGVGVSLLLLPLGDGTLLALMLWAALSDGLDGFIARRWSWRSELGGAIDLTADGIFFLGALIQLWQRGLLPGAWLLAILAGSVPELLAQAIRWHRGLPPGTLGHPLNKLLGGASYVFVLAIAVGADATILGPMLLTLQLLANGRDLIVTMARAPVQERHQEVQR